MNKRDRLGTTYFILMWTVFMPYILADDTELFQSLVCLGALVTVSVLWIFNADNKPDAEDSDE